MNSSLVAMASAAARIEQLLIENEGLITDEIRDLMTLDSAIPAKVDAYDFIMKRIASISLEYEKKARFYMDLAESLASIQKRMKDNIKESMQLLTTDELNGEDIRFKLVATMPKLIVAQPELVPQEYKKHTVVEQIDNARLKVDLKTKEIPGCYLEESFALKTYANRKG